MVVNGLLFPPYFLQDHKYFEDAFKVYERGVQVFKYPHVRDIWATYLSKFVKRYGGKKLERARDLFEQAVEKVGHFLLFHVFLLFLWVQEVTIFISSGTSGRC